MNGKTVLALATYERALEKFPRSQSLEAAAGRLAVSRQHYEEAERWLKLAQERNTPDAEIAYSLGLAEDALGREREAETAYEIAYRQAGRRVAAAIRLGELRARAGDVEGAAAYFRAALDADVPNSRAREELGTVLRANGRRAEADKMAGLGLSADPMSDFLKADTGKPDLEHLAADPYRVLRVADEYMRLGLYRQALGVLERNYPAVAADQSEPGSVLPQNHPLVLYYAAYCKQKLGEVSGRDWQTASELSC